MATVDWTRLPPELMTEISRRLKSYADYLALRSVSRTWRSSVPKTPTHLPPQSPWVILPHPKPNHCAFFDPSTNKSYLLYLPEIAASPGKKLIRGSSHGFLVVVEDSPSILLVNPLTRAKVCLPPLSSFPCVIRFDYSNIGQEYTLADDRLGWIHSLCLGEMRDLFVSKVVLSSNPSNKTGFVAVAILDFIGGLAYCRDRDSSWTVVNDVDGYFFEDVVFLDGLFYALRKGGEVAVLEVVGNSDTPPVVSYMETRLPPSMGDVVYLVRSRGDLLLVTRSLDLVDELGYNLEAGPVLRTSGFQVFRMDFHEQRWVKVASLGDTALFLARNSSLSVSVSDFPGCMGDCLYYTDDYGDGLGYFDDRLDYGDHMVAHDMGIFKLRDGSIEPLPSFWRNPLWPRPVWVSPNPC